MMDKKYIENELSDSPYKIEVQESVTSTNLLLKEKARDGENEFSVLIASRQTAGRGRRGRTFFSPGNTGLYMSILLRPEDDATSLNVTTDAAVVYARALEKVSGKKTQIKWVNDIYIDGKKVCGILAESNLDENRYIVLGIGVNVIYPEQGFPEDIDKTACALFEQKTAYAREKTAVCILREFMNIYQNRDEEKILEEYRIRNIVPGKDIDILKNGECEKGHAIGIDDDYSLIVKKVTGEIIKISFGDVSVRI